MNGLYRKYDVIKRASGEPVEDDCMVLKLNDRHARTALLAYADAVAEENPRFAFDLRLWVWDHDPTVYREVWTDVLPPGGYVCNICGVPVESEPCDAHSGSTT